MRRAVFPLIVTLILGCTSVCSANYADYGPLYDVLAVRKAFALQYRLPWQVVVRVTVVRDYALATASSKGAIIMGYRRHRGRWTASPSFRWPWDAESAAKAEAAGVPPDVVATMLRQMR